jgi:2-polyprenyl-6-methoxyphenol hydroxylase-like FAD-dependent oxidoreductase
VPSDNQRVIVIGAGLSGLATAAALHHAGVPTVVFERAPEMRPVGAIIGVAANAASGLERIGQARLVEEICIPVQRLDYLSWSGRSLTHMPIAEVARDLGTRTFIALRAEIQLGLLRGLPSDAVQLSSTCTGFDQDDEGVTARFEDGREERGAVLIGADGIRSAVRSQLRGDEPRYSGYSGWRGVAELDPQPLEPGLAKQVLGSGRTFGTFGLTGGRMYWWASLRMPAGRGDSSAGRKADVLAAFEGAPALVHQLLDATDESAMLRNDIFDWPPVERWSEGRVTLVGDAAHATTPNTGEGGSHAVLDGIFVGGQLAEIKNELSDTSAVRGALEAFEKVRIPETADVVNRSAEIGEFLHKTNPLMCLVRDQIFYRATPQRIWRKRAAVYLAANK